MTHSKQLKTLMSISLAFFSTTIFSQVSDLDDLPEFVQQQLKYSAKQYLAYKKHIANKGGNNVVSMGNDPNCDIDINIANIQQVIDNGADEIRLADNASYTEDLFISNKSIIIRGGFNDCADANNNIQQNSKTLITGTGTASVISISGSDNTHEIVFQNLDIRNGSGSDFFYGGGISTLGAKANITLENVNVAYNTGEFGGGIAINSGQTSLTLIDSLVQDNEANIGGGGIHCLGEDNSLALFGESGIIDNTALAQIGVGAGGGGLHITQGCSASVFSGSSSHDTQFGISGNVSEYNGGGISVEEGAQLSLYGQEFCVLNVCFGDSSNPVNVSHNIARDHHVYDFYGNGGGIYAGYQTQIFMQGVLINHNTAEQKGGGVYSGGISFEISRNNRACWNQQRCNLIQGNKTQNAEDDDTFGGGLYILGGEPEISHAYLEDNRADYGAALHMRFTDLGVSSSVFNHNGEAGAAGIDDINLISVEGQSILTLEHVTITDNQLTNAVIGRYDSANFDLNIYSSIIHDEDSGLLFSGVQTYLDTDIDCLIAHEIASINGMLGTNLLVADPQFKDPAQRDYHLNAALSPAVDFCVQHNVLGYMKDIDGQSRGWDDSSIINNQNDPSYVFDAGADETYDNDIIFKDGFED